MEGWMTNSALPALEQTAIFAQRRHQLLAGNLANADTPDYQTRDLSVQDFKQQLRNAVDPNEPTGNVYVPGRGNLPLSRQQVIDKVRDVGHQILYHDGSDVSLEQQVTEIAKNQTMHNTAIALMRSQFQTMQVAIRESVNV